MAVENLSIFVERCWYPEVLKIQTRIHDTSEMLNFIDYLNKSNVWAEDWILVSFDIVNMCPSIFPPTDCIIEALKSCLESNNSVFNNKHFLQTNGTAQGPHTSCSYGDIIIESFDKKHYSITPQL